MAASRLDNCKFARLCVKQCLKNTVFSIMKAIIILAILLPMHIQAQVVSQWRGAQRSGIYQESNLMKEWPEEGPAELWSTDQIGTGWGSASVSDEAIYIIGTKDTLEYCSKIDLKGELIWQVTVGPGWMGSYRDAKTTPTVIGNKVYVINTRGRISCLDASSGFTIWTVDGYNKYEGYCTEWGVCESPLIIDNMIVYTPGGDSTTMVALDRETGETVWMSESLRDSTAYVSPLLIQQDDMEIICSISANYFFGIDARGGNVLWKYKYYDLKWNQDHTYTPIINCNTPVYKDGKIYIAKGYDHYGAQFTLEQNGSAIELIRIDSVLDVHFGGMILYEGYLYGANWLNNSNGNWCCVDWESGEVKYETHWNSKGSIIMADDMLYCYEEKRGNMALVRPNPEKFDMVSSFQITKGRGPHWAHPVIRDGVLYVRHGNTLMAYDISANTNQIN